MTLSQESINVVKATAPVVAKHALEITSTFYHLMFTNNPEMLHYFNKQNQRKGRQQEALADAVVAYATNIEHLERLGGLVARMAHRHCALSVTPNLYQVVHDNLMQAIGQVLGDAATTEIQNAWSEAVMALASIAIDAEEKLYTANETRRGGWRYEREFVLTKKQQVADDTVKFEFTPADGYKGGFDFEPGQYITIRCKGLDAAPRHYTIVSQPGDETISICTRKLPGGQMSVYMHETLKEGDKVLLAAPCGVFVTKPTDDKVVFITAGIGATPALAMLPSVPADAVKAALHVESSIKRNVLRECYETSGILPRATIVYTKEPNSPEQRPDLSVLLPKIVEQGGKDAAYIVCGPKEFMSTVQEILLSLECADVRTEVFGTGQVKPKTTS